MEQIILRRRRLMLETWIDRQDKTFKKQKWGERLIFSNPLSLEKNGLYIYPPQNNLTYNENWSCD